MVKFKIIELQQDMAQLELKENGHWVGTINVSFDDAFNLKLVDVMDQNFIGLKNIPEVYFQDLETRSFEYMRENRETFQPQNDCEMNDSDSNDDYTEYNGGCGRMPLF